mmetsp:Transcript_65449/g.173466  ORF Transcript_65449/g.173466 Transcript_65449/m.173466 type:complete len:830 (-) Transcript_65449:134-2623(-)
MQSAMREPFGDLVDAFLLELQSRLALEVSEVVGKLGRSTKQRLFEIHTLAIKDAVLASRSEPVSVTQMADDPSQEESPEVRVGLRTPFPNSPAVSRCSTMDENLRRNGAKYLCSEAQMHIHDCPGARVSLDVDTDDCDGKNAFPMIQDLLRKPGNQSHHDDPFERAITDVASTMSTAVMDVNRLRTRSSSSNVSGGILAKARFSANDRVSPSLGAQMDALKTPEPQVRHHASVKSHSYSDRSTVLGRIRMWPIWENVSSTELSTSYFTVPHTCSINPAMEEEEGPTEHCPCVVATPSSFRRVAWDILSFAVMGYDILYIPLQAFDIPPTVFTDVMAWVTTVFWTVDIFCTFMVGYHDGGIIEVRPNRVACHYLKTWFALDLATVSVDWFFIIGTSGVGSDSTAGLVRIMKSMRFARVMRVFRLLRIVKVLSLVDEFSDFIHSEGLLAVLKILKLTVGIAILNHFVACGWYALGNMDMQNSWVDSMMTIYPDASIGFLYTTSLHWSLTQFTPASMEVVPRNVWERLYTACIIILALVMFSSFVSSITQAMTRLQDMNRERWRQQENVRRFIVDNHLSLELSNRIYSYLRKHRTMTRSVLHENDVPVFGAMPETLRVRLHCEVFTPILKVHPFFFHFYEADHQGVANVCHSAMAQESLLMGQELFIHGERSEKMFFVVSGEMDYLLGTGQAVPLSVREGAHVAEMALWLQWHNRGLMSTTMPCEVVSIDSAVFRGIVCQTVVFEQSQQYARDFAQTFVATANGDFSRLSDLWGDFDDLQEIAQQAFDRSGGVTRHQRLKKFATQQSKLGSKLSLSTELSGFQRIVRRFAPQ